MVASYNVRVKDTRGRFQRIHCRIYTKLGNFSAQHGRSIKVTECRCRCRVCKVIRRDINRLHGCNGSVLCRCNSLLHLSHFRCQRWLITNRRRHTSKKGRHLRTSLSETEDVIDKEENILRAGCIRTVTERLCKGKSRQSYRRTRSRWLVHLAEYHGYLRLGNFIIIYLGEIPLTLLHPLEEFLSISDNTGLDHFTQKVISLPRTLSDSCKH